MRKLLNEELNRKTVAEFKEAKKLPLVVVLDNVRSQNNIGSVFRTCDAFLVEKIFLCGITSVPPNKEIHKTALGATETVEWKYFQNTEDAIHQLRNEGFCILCIEQAEQSVMLNDYKPDVEQKYGIVLGNEVRGVEQHVVDQSDLCIEIPQLGSKHSLNIAVSAGIVIWDLFTKFQQDK